MSAAIAERVGAFAAGALVAQKFIEELRLGQAVPAETPDRYRDLAIEWGCDSLALHGFLIELGKRAAR